MKLYLIRHGESIGNVNDMVQGQLDLDLTPKGYEQAKKIGERLKDNTIDKIFSSDLRRAVETAKAINQYHEVPLVKTPTLREISRGIYEGSLNSNVPNSLKIKSPNNKYDGGESFNEVIQRIKPFYNQLLEEETGKELVIVAHGNVLKSLIAVIHKKETLSEEEFEKFLEEWNITNTGLYEISLINPDSPDIITKNCNNHLN